MKDGKKMSLNFTEIPWNLMYYTHFYLPWGPEPEKNKTTPPHMHTFKEMFNPMNSNRIIHIFEHMFKLHKINILIASKKRVRARACMRACEGENLKAGKFQANILPCLKTA